MKKNLSKFSFQLIISTSECSWESISGTDIQFTCLRLHIVVFLATRFVCHHFDHEGIERIITDKQMDKLKTHKKKTKRETKVMAKFSKTECNFNFTDTQMGTFLFNQNRLFSCNFSHCKTLLNDSQ